jgi:hypothetical protein
MWMLFASAAACGTTSSGSDTSRVDASTDSPLTGALSDGGDDGAADVSTGDSPSGSPDAALGSFHVVAFQAPVAPAQDAHYAAIAVSGTVTGPVIEVLWNSIDTAGKLDWAALDGTSSAIYRYMAAYPTEQFSILFDPVTDNTQNSATPLDVLTSAGQQICFCKDGYPGDTAGNTNGCFLNGTIDGTTQDLTGLPVPFTGSFAARWQGFIGAAIARLNAASYRPQILYVTFGVSNGGEDIPKCSGPEAALATPPTTKGLSTAWIANLAGQDSAIQVAKPTFPVVVGTSCLEAQEPPDGSTANDDCALFADLEAQTNASHGIGMRITTLQQADLLAYSENTPTVSDWAANTLAYPDVPIVWQTSAESDPVGTGTASCIRNGSLATLLPFVTKHSSPNTPLRVLEAYYHDLEGTYVPGYQDPCWPAGAVTADPYGPYDSAFKAAIATQ